MTLTGPDVSHHQGTVDMDAVAAAGHSFVGIKVTEGSTYSDPKHSTNSIHAANAGLIRLLYHFARPGKDATIADARAEAEWFVKNIITLTSGEIAVLDIEDNQGVGDLSAWALAWLARVDELTGRAGDSPTDDAVLYTYGPYAKAHLRAGALGDKTLWLAAYNSHPTVPPPWKNWTFHQYTSSGSCPGIVGRCDLNLFTGPLSALNVIAGIGDESTIPTSSGPVIVTATDYKDSDMRAVKITMTTGNAGNGWVEVNARPEDIVNVVFNDVAKQPNWTRKAGTGGRARIEVNGWVHNVTLTALAFFAV